MSAHVAERVRPHAEPSRAGGEVGDGRDRAYGKWGHPGAAVTPP
ncbi:hypothetical protein ACWDVU_16125 [Streptomyces sp. NPDC003333]